MQSAAHEKSLEHMPASFVVKLGTVQSPFLSELVQNFRMIMSPKTAMNLRERRTNKVKDYEAVCGQLGVTYCLFFSQTLFNSMVRMACFPQGPTLCFNIDSYTLMKDIAKNTSSPVSLDDSKSLPPLLIMDGFQDSSTPQIKLCESFLKHMFPENPTSHDQLSQRKRVVLFKYDGENDEIIVRHYKIQVKSSEPTVEDVIKKVGKNLPEILEKGQDIADFVLENLSVAGNKDKNAGLYEHDFSTEVAPKKQKTAKRLHLVETGPRLSLVLSQIQEGFCKGENIYFKDFRHKEETGRERTTGTEAPASNTSD